MAEFRWWSALCHHWRLLVHRLPLSPPQKSTSWETIEYIRNIGLLALVSTDI
ncbi:hypothetical protein HanIR_Chr03g0101991 [Helianthus annuus]|nr:hypothetical protein HanIR_Chr03g0101991 [Helianthus annuus]